MDYLRATLEQLKTRTAHTLADYRSTRLKPGFVMQK